MANGDFTQADVEAMIAEALERDRAAHREEMENLRRSLSGVTASPVPAHSAGPGTDVQPTWSLHDQTLATHGEHPLQQAGT
jgi:hypothetical protein